MSDNHLFVGPDVPKATIAIAVAEQGRTGEVRYIGSFPNKPASIISQLKRPAERYGGIECVYEAGPCAYTLYRKLSAAGIRCIVVAPSKLPMPRGRVKNDHRDAVALARLLRAGGLVPIWVPDPVHEAMRDLVRARQAASFDVRKARQRIQNYLLLRDRHFAGKSWSSRHMRWISPPVSVGTRSHGILWACSGGAFERVHSAISRNNETRKLRDAGSPLRSCLVLSTVGEDRPMDEGANAR